MSTRRTSWLLLALPLLLGLSLAPAPAQQKPLSAIDWLSRSVRDKPAANKTRQPQTPPVAPANPLSETTPAEPIPMPAPDNGPPPPPSDSAPADAAPAEGPPALDHIQVTPLGDIRKDSVGILPMSVTGLPHDFWGDTDVTTLAGLVTQQPIDSLPEMLSLLYKLLLAEVDAPRNDPTGSGETLLLARIDKLLELGALDQAQALIERAGPDDAQLFRRWFDVSLLTGHVDHACAAMRSAPGFAPTLQARIFCLARQGDWNAAMLTLATGETLGFLTREQADLLARFLDPGLYEGEPDLPAPKPLTPLVFTMREALSMPRPAGSLPLAFVHVDLSENNGWRTRLEAAERLARSQAIAPNVLISLYNEGKPAASGGIWDRVRALQAFDVALLSGDDAAISKTLPPAWRAMQNAALEVPFALYYGERLPGRALTADAARIAFTVELLSRGFEKAARAYRPQDPRETFLRALALGRLQGVKTTGTLETAIKSAFTEPMPQGPLRELLQKRRLGESILRAMLLLKDGALADPGDITAALSAFRAVGLEAEARRTALQLLLVQRRG